MSVHKRSFKNRLSYILLAVVIILALLTTVFFAQLSRHISEISEFESKQAALDVINDIPLRLHQIGAAKTELKSDLTEAGINQTKYSLYLTVTIEMTAILPAHSTDIVVSYDYPVSETVIVGEIPDMYLDKGKG